MMTRLFVVIICLGAACSKKDLTPLDKCSSSETWTLKQLNFKEVKLNISFPDWQTELDFINGDTISITALDSIKYAEIKKLRSVSLMQYGTTIDIDSNFQVIKEALITYSESGEIKVKGYDGRYLIREEVFESDLKSDTVTTFLTLLQTDNLAINIIARMTKEKENEQLFCDFKQVLETIDFEKRRANTAQVPTTAIKHYF